ncbi:MAG: 30S ribosomal protein S6 [Clostridia bacterium]|nr:30S ribosomal protein S6 [Clostridia bacterium]
MEKKTCYYETLFVVDGSLAEAEAKATIEKFTSLVAENGELVKVDEWGKRRLAYPIDKKVEGYYVMVAFNSDSAFPNELDRLFGINDAVLRSMTVQAKKPTADKAPEAAPVATEENAD